MTEDEKRYAIADHIDELAHLHGRYPGAWKPATQPRDLHGYLWRWTPLPELTGQALDEAYREATHGSRPPQETA